MTLQILKLPATHEPGRDMLASAGQKSHAHRKPKRPDERSRLSRPGSLGLASQVSSALDESQFYPTPEMATSVIFVEKKSQPSCISHVMPQFAHATSAIAHQTAPTTLCRKPRPRPQPPTTGPSVRAAELTLCATP